MSDGFRMSEWQRAFARAPEVSPRAKAVGWSLWSYAEHRTGERARPGLTRLRADTGMSDATVKRGLSELVEKRWIRTIRKGNRSAGGAGFATEYRLTLPRDIEGSPVIYRSSDDASIEGSPVSHRSSGSRAQDDGSRAQSDPIEGSKRSDRGLTDEPPPKSEASKSEASKSEAPGGRAREDECECVMDEQDVMDQEQHDGLVDDEITANENVAPWDWWREEPPEQDDDPGDVMPIENITEITEEEDDLPTHPSSRDDDPEDDITEMTVTPTGDTRDDVTPRAVDPDPTVYAPSPARSRDRPGQGHPDPSATVSGPQDGQHEAPDHQNNPYNSDRRNPR